jgi:hypothetical protein
MLSDNSDGKKVDRTDLELVEASIEQLQGIYQKLRKDFPASERKEYSHLKRLMQKGLFKTPLRFGLTTSLLIRYTGTPGMAPFCSIKY